MKTEFEVTMTIEVKDVGDVKADSRTLLNSLKEAIEGLNSGDVVSITEISLSRKRKIGRWVNVFIAGHALVISDCETGDFIKTFHIPDYTQDYIRNRVRLYISQNSLTPTKQSVACLPWLK